MRVPLLVAACAAGWTAAAAAREVTVAGEEAAGFGRVVLTFDVPTGVNVRSQNGVLVLGFDGPAQILSERLERDLAGYVSAVRRDPDGTGLRLALARPVRPNLMNAGERVFVDLLPASWTGLPPSLPPAVVAALAERAQAAETALKRLGGKAREPAAVTLRSAELPSLTRLVLEAPPGTPLEVTGAETTLRAVFDGPVRLDRPDGAARTGEALAGLTTRSEKGRLAVTVESAPGFAIHSFREGDSLVVDLAKPGPAPALPEPLPRPAAPAAPAEGLRPAPVGMAPAAAPAPPPAVQTAHPPAAAAPAPRGGGERVAVRAESGPEGRSLVFPFRAPTPAAAFERGDEIRLLFEGPDRLDLRDGAPALADLAEVAELDGGGGGAILLRVKPKVAGPARLQPDGTGWRLVLGGPAAMPPDALPVGLRADANGQPELLVGLASPSSPRWLRDPDHGGRVAVVPALGRPQGVASARRFVEFGLPPTLQGVVVEAASEDVTVAPAAGGIAVGRRSGLSLSGPGGAPGADPGSELVLQRKDWLADSAGDVLERYRALVADAAEAPRSGQGEARWRLARFLVANGLNLEAASVLALARSADPVFAKRREAALLSGIAAARSGRDKEAAGLLAAEGLAEDPEAVLWRAVLDGRARRWRPSLGGFVRSAGVLRAYPDGLSGPLRLLALGVALEAGEVARAEAELAAIDRLGAGSVPSDAHDLARARVDEASGRTEEALKSYERLAEEADRPVAAEATLRAVTLASRLGKMEDAEAIRRLEGLVVTWRGDAVELAAAAALSRFYAAAGRWRDVFGIAQATARRFPEHELTRGLYEETARLFEAVLLGGQGASLPPVEILALFYDFKEFAPVGRRGDEMVRRLADRLVELDLLAQAADLLQHQVDHRLAGAARASVAARLAAIRLLDGDPARAVQALHATRLAGLPAGTRRVRLLLEARAQADLSRVDLALEILDGEADPEAERLRAGILFGARRWREAGEAGEKLAGLSWRDAAPLPDRQRAAVLRAAIAYVLADERIALERLRAKFGRSMADSPDARSFELLLRPGIAGTREFRKLAVEAARADGLKELLEGWTGSDREAAAPSADASAAPVAGAG